MVLHLRNEGRSSMGLTTAGAMGDREGSDALEFNHSYNQEELGISEGPLELESRFSNNGKAGIEEKFPDKDSLDSELTDFSQLEERVPVVLGSSI